jgi:hypothetical protein
MLEWDKMGEGGGGGRNQFFLNHSKNECIQKWFRERLIDDLQYMTNLLNIRRIKTELKMGHSI